MTNAAQMRNVITCILPAGCGGEVVARLRKAGVDSAFVHHARGVGESGKKRRGAGFYVEREIITALVEVDRVDEIFELLYEEAGIGQPHAGLLFIERSPHGAPLVLPDLPEES